MTMTTTSFNAAIVNSIITALRFLLQALNVPIQAIQTIQQKIFPSSNNQSNMMPSKTVVVVGGNFAGLAAVSELLSQKGNQFNLKVILIDQRDYSEYTPGILRLFCDTSAFFHMTQPLPASNKQQQFQCLQGRVTSLVDGSNNNNSKTLTYTPTATLLPHAAPSRTPPPPPPQTLKYDYVILATGATYTAPISPTPQEWTLSDRFKGWQAAHVKLKQAQSVIVLGGGAVGVELAAEIVDFFPDKSITLLDAQSSLVPLFPKYVGKYAQQWLKQRGVTVLLGQSLQSWTDTECTLQDGTVLQADMVYVCFGSKANSEATAVQEGTSNNHKTQPLFSLTKGKTVVVKDTLQMKVVENHNNNNDNDDGISTVLQSIFACGDVATPPNGDEKQALQAEIQGKVAARNVLQLLGNNNNNNNTKLYRYPHDLSGSSQMPLVFVLSLGRYDGVLGFNALLIPGPLAAIVKWVLEYTKVLDMRGELLGKLIWKLADAVVLFLSRTLIPPQSSTTSSSYTSGTSKQEGRLKVA